MYTNTYTLFLYEIRIRSTAHILELDLQRTREMPDAFVS